MIDGNNDRSIATDSLHAGQEPDPTTGARAPPLYQITSFVFVDGGSFLWDDHAGKYPEIAMDDLAYHGVNFAETFGEAAFTYAAIARGLRDLGNQQALFDAWQTLQGLETLPLRMDRHCENAMAVAEFLQSHEDVSWVSYPGLESYPTYDNATEYLDSGYGGMITFGLAGGYDDAQKIVESTELASMLANIGDAEKEASGVTNDLVRLSVGIEDLDTLLPI